MEDNNIAKALGQISELIKSNKALVEYTEKVISTFAEALQQRPQAVIPADELKKVYSAAAHGVSDTRCATPDVDDVNKLVAGKIISDVAGSVKETTKDAVKEAVKDVPVKVEHVHTHTTLRDLREAADQKIKDINTALLILVASSFITFVGAFLISLTSDYHMAEQYRAVCRSEYITDSEKNALTENIYVMEYLPLEYYDSPKLVKENLKRYRNIIKIRKREARKNKGDWSAISKKYPIER